MAKRRYLKHSIKQACDELFNECIAVSLYQNVNIENTAAMLRSIVKIRRDYVSRISHAEPGMKPKTYFADLINSFKSQAIEIVDQINNF